MNDIDNTFNKEFNVQTNVKSESNNLSTNKESDTLELVEDKPCDLYQKKFALKMKILLKTQN